MFNRKRDQISNLQSMLRSAHERAMRSEKHERVLYEQIDQDTLTLNNDYRIIRRLTERLNAEEQKVADLIEQVDLLVGELELVEGDNGRMGEALNIATTENETLRKLLGEATFRQAALTRELNTLAPQDGPEKVFEGFVPFDSPLGRAISQAVGLPAPPPTEEEVPPGFEEFGDLTDEPPKGENPEYPLCPECGHRHPQQG